MGETRTAEEVRAEFTASMGPQFGPFWDLLRDELILLHAKWHQYRQLYGSSSERIELLNNSASFFFFLVQDILWDDIVLHIARLVERAGRGDRQVLTIQRIPAFVGGTRIESTAKAHVDAVITATQFVREWRNKRVAHRDLQQLLKQRPTPLTGGSRADVESALDAFRSLYNHVGAFYSQGHTIFDLPGMPGAECLLRRLAVGKEAHDARMERLRTGTASPADWGPGP
jgi:hypothetical protein